VAGESTGTTGAIMIAVPRDRVMSVIADFAAYPTWAGMQSAEVLGDPGPGGRARMVRFGLAAGPIRDSFVLRYEWDDDAQVRWELAEPGAVLSEMTGAYTLAGGNGQTEVTFELTIGARIPVLGPVRRRVEKTIIETALKGLKTQAEQAYGSAAP
jgi:Polyketide cyclase / dehydrase and lipid transport